MDRQVIVDRRDSAAPTVVTVLLIAAALLLAWFYLGGERQVINVPTPQVQTDTGASTNVPAGTNAQ